MDLLLLLMGGNPLPNYITADYTLKPDRTDKNDIPAPGKIIFVSTDQTEKFFQSILILLKKKHKSPLPQSEEVKLGIKHRSPEFIREEIIKVLKKNPGLDSIHLNYTGGTKPMAANAVMAVSAFTREKGIKLILSDLDPDNFKLTIFKVNSNDNIPEENNFPRERDLRDYVHLKIDEIFDLHEMALVTKKKGKALLKDDMIDIIPISLAMAADYKTNNRRERFLEISKELEKSDPKINEKIISNRPYLKGIFDENSKLKITPNQFYDFINGKWLEYYLYSCLKKLETKLKIEFSDIGMSVEAEYEKRKCEIDVIAMRGFQMFLFSCTTSQKIKIVKQKAFEALFRAEQLGGEHAEVIVVSTMFNTPGIPGKIKFSKKSNLQELAKDVNQFNTVKKCEFIGIDELSNETNLMKKLSDIITQN